MNNFNNNNSKEQKQEEIDKKLEFMRNSLFDEQKCKEIAQKLCAYISKK
ncbi:hypothetical protein IJX73_05965 [bacterium]|nr:hypothetical protein [bacterium]